MTAIDEGDVFALDQFAQQLAIGGLRLVGHHHPRTDRQGHEQFGNGDVEGQRRDGQRDMAGVDAGHAAQAGEQVAHAAVRRFR